MPQESIEEVEEDGPPERCGIEEEEEEVIDDVSQVWEEFDEAIWKIREET